MTITVFCIVLVNQLIFLMIISEKADFIRHQYLHLNWYSRDGKKLSDGLHPYSQITDLDTHCEIDLNRAGTFHFYFTYDKR